MLRSFCRILSGLVRFPLFFFFKSPRLAPPPSSRMALVSWIPGPLVSYRFLLLPIASYYWQGKAWLFLFNFLLLLFFYRFLFLFSIPRTGPSTCRVRTNRFSSFHFERSFDIKAQVGMVADHFGYRQAPFHSQFRLFACQCRFPVIDGIDLGILTKKSHYTHVRRDQTNTMKKRKGSGCIRTDTDRDSGAGSRTRRTGECRQTMYRQDGRMHCYAIDRCRYREPVSSHGG